jgi:hypothetical protein
LNVARSDSMLFGITWSVWALVTCLAVYWFLNATHNGLTIVFGHPIALIVAGLSGFAIPLLPRAWPLWVKSLLPLLAILAVLLTLWMTWYLLVAGGGPPRPRRGSSIDLVHPKIGVRYEYNTFTHCAFNGVRIDGERWAPVEGFIAREDLQFGISFDRGWVILTDADHGTYISETGFQVPIEPATASTPMSDPGCI